MPFADVPITKKISDKYAGQQFAPITIPAGASFADMAALKGSKEMVDRLTNLIGIFEEPALDFSKNRAEGADILGDVYEHLMRHFATESGKSKGQSYTPSEGCKSARAQEVRSRQLNG